LVYFSFEKPNGVTLILSRSGKDSKEILLGLLPHCQMSQTLAVILRLFPNKRLQTHILAISALHMNTLRERERFSHKIVAKLRPCQDDNIQIISNPTRILESL
jgi:hypothetical protein